MSFRPADSKAEEEEEEPLNFNLKELNEQQVELTVIPFALRVSIVHEGHSRVMLLPPNLRCDELVCHVRTNLMGPVDGYKQLRVRVDIADHSLHVPEFQKSSVYTRRIVKMVHRTLTDELEARHKREARGRALEQVAKIGQQRVEARKRRRRG